MPKQKLTCSWQIACYYKFIPVPCTLLEVEEDKNILLNKFLAYNSMALKLNITT